MRAGLSSESVGVRRGEERLKPISLPFGRKVISVRSTSLETRTLIKPTVLDTFPEMPQISSPFPTRLSPSSIVFLRVERVSREISFYHFYSLRNSIAKDFLNRLSYMYSYVNTRISNCLLYI